MGSSSCARTLLVKLFTITEYKGRGHVGLFRSGICFRSTQIRPRRILWVLPGHRTAVLKNCSRNQITVWSPFLAAALTHQTASSFGRFPSARPFWDLSPEFYDHERRPYGSARDGSRAAWIPLTATPSYVGQVGTFGAFRAAREETHFTS